MKNIKRISGRLWQLVIGLTALIIQLNRQMVFPNRKRKGNLLNILFLFYIGVIACIQHFEHNRFKMADLFRSRLVRRGLMLGSFFLFFLLPTNNRSLFKLLLPNLLQLNILIKAWQLNYLAPIQRTFRLNYILRNHAFPIFRFIHVQVIYPMVLIATFRPSLAYLIEGNQSF